MLFGTKLSLCYIKFSDLFLWIKENNLLEKSFLTEKAKWAKKINKEPNFFSDTELLIVQEDILVLKVPDQNHANFLVKTYKLEDQGICQKLFQEQKHIIIISNNQWQAQTTNDESLFVLFKDRESIEKSLKNWLS